ncbi:hypothetical protein K461DRAFT_226593 [Myriangium duriaei CBS 260.36]|uniref:Uncharacterized protein n=1 Tax=Myriangium duriaei CBS 260.36 TaxID=1168546 RepID=A0A9P4J3C1_9PEZI|nr:hypothetical protein K461DRAFT_226593 [Myriangium duriaei CBS 260.36]
MLEARPVQHKRTASHESTSSSGSAHRLILEHILQYPGTYEIPLRTMYALNSVPHTTALPKLPNGKASPPQRANKLNPGDAAQKLSSSLMAELQQKPNQPNSLPPSFITSFVRKCFAPELRLVDFPQALTGLDYLKDLETRRSRELKSALERLEITLENCDIAQEVLSQRYPDAQEWYLSLADHVHKVEALYTQLYIALRRWILVNELSLQPFSKHNCVAMLNTVYPPVMATQPTPLLSLSVLKSQRDGFFKYIQAVEKNGPSILSNLIAQGKRVGEETGWPSVREILDRYLQAANHMIDECQQIVSIHDSAKIASVQDARRKADSGIDFVNDSPRKSSTSSEGSVAESERPVSRSYKSTTTLEKIAREFRHMRRTKTDVSEMITVNTTNPAPATESTTTSPTESRSLDKSLRKMRSLGSIRLGRQASRSSSVASTQLPDYDMVKLNQQRKAFEMTLMAAAV